MLKSGDVVSPVEWAVRMTLLGGKFNKSNPKIDQTNIIDN